MDVRLLISLAGPATELTARGPDPFVDTPEPLFERCMRYLHSEGYTVISMAELERYVEPGGGGPQAPRL